MTNFKEPKPDINRSKTIKPLNINVVDKIKAVDDIVKIIRENKRIVEAAAKQTNHENLHR